MYQYVNLVYRLEYVYSKVAFSEKQAETLQCVSADGSGTSQTM